MIYKNFLKNNKKGFTLIEILVAIFILTVGILGIVYAFPLSLKINNYAKMKTIASQLAQEKIEEINSMSYFDIPVGVIEPKSSLPEPFQNFSREVEVNYYNPVNREIVVDDLEIKKIKVDVEWDFGFMALSNKIEVISLISQR